MKTITNFIDSFDEKQNLYMVFNCADTKYAINIDNVIEVIKLPMLEYPKRIPNNAIGLLKYENLMINVFDIRFFFDIDIDKYDIHTKLLILKTDESIFSIVAENIDDIISIEEENIHSFPNENDKSLIQAVYKFGNQTINILDAYTVEDLLKKKKREKKINVEDLFPKDEYSIQKFEEHSNYLKEKSNSTGLQNIFPMDKFISFTLNDNNYCMDLKFVKEISNNSKIVLLPGAPEFVEGLITIRGKFYTIINLKNFLGLKQQEYKNKKNIIIINSEEFQVGFIVDNIYEIFELTEEEITNNQFLNAAPFIFNEIVKNDKIYTLLDMPDILNSDKILIDEKETVF